MSDNKVRLRNLDEEVLRYLHATSGTIGFDQLSPDVVTEIKNKTSTSGTPYNDSELRNRIGTIESTMVTKTSADSLYATKKDYDTSAVVDSKIAKAKSTVETEITNIDKNFISKTPGSITEDLLSYELRAKVNSSTSGSSSTGSNTNLDELKNNINKNTSAISEIKNTLNTNVYLKSSPISVDNMDDNTQTLIHNARQDTTLITENDLDTALKNKINQQETYDIKAKDIINSMYNGSEDGQILIAKRHNDMAAHKVYSYYSVVPKYIFATDVFIFQIDSKYLDQQIVIADDSGDSEDSTTFESGKSYAQNHNYTYIADIKRNVLLTYNENNGTWTEDNGILNVYNRLIGTFTLSYPDNTIYFCNGYSKENLIKIFSPNDYISEADLDIFDTRITAIENKLVETTNAEIDAMFTTM